MGEVVKGWDFGVATMLPGEKARLTLAPEYAYGEKGAGEKIPANATLIFEVELVSFQSEEDLLGDGGVIRTKIRPPHAERKEEFLAGAAPSEALEAVLATGSFRKPLCRPLLGTGRGLFRHAMVRPGS